MRGDSSARGKRNYILVRNSKFQGRQLPPQILDSSVSLVTMIRTGRPRNHGSTAARGNKFLHQMLLDSLVKRLQVVGSLSTFNLHGQPAPSFNGASSFVQRHALSTFGPSSAAFATVPICRDSGPPVNGPYLHKAT